MESKRGSSYTQGMKERDRAASARARHTPKRPGAKDVVGPGHVMFPGRGRSGWCDLERRERGEGYVLQWPLYEGRVVT